MCKGSNCQETSHLFCLLRGFLCLPEVISHIGSGLQFLPDILRKFSCHQLTNPVPAGSQFQSLPQPLLSPLSSQEFP